MSCEAITRRVVVAFGSVALVFTAASAETNPNNRAALTNFTPNLPIVYLKANEVIVSERKVPCSVAMVLPGAPETNVLKGVVRIHGASSQIYPKKSFAFTLDAPMRWLGMRESTHWVLNAAFVDRSLMRHKLSYDLFLALSAPGAKRYAAQSRFVEVNLNGKYNGAYLLLERVDRALLELKSFDSNATAHACIYKAEDHGANFRQQGHAAYEQREPDPLVREYWAPLDDFNRFVGTSSDAKFFDPRTGVASQLDLDNTIDFHLLLLLTSNMDGYDKNIIFARNAPLTNAPPPRFFFVPWDYDATFGRNWNSTRVGHTDWLSNHLFERLLGDAPYQKKFAARWKQLRAAQFSRESIVRMIDENAGTLGAAAHRNQIRWRTLEGGYPDRLSFEEDVAQMKEWVGARLSWLDQEIDRRAGAGR